MTATFFQLAGSLGRLLLDAMRWLDRLGYHAWRISNYLGGDMRPEPALAPGEPGLNTETGPPM